MIEGLAALVILMILFIWIAFFVMLILDYIFSSIAMSRMMTKQNIDYPFLAWIPIARAYALGSIHDDIKRQQGKDPRFRFILLACVLAQTIFLIYVIATIIPILISLFQSSSSTDRYWYIDQLSNPISVQLQLLGWLAPIAQVVGIAYIVIYFISLYVIFKKYAPKNQSYFVCSIIFSIIPVVPFLPGLFLLKASKNNPASNHLINIQR